MTSNSRGCEPAGAGTAAERINRVQTSTFGRLIPEVGAHDAYDRPAYAIDYQRPPEDVRPAVEAGLPQAMADYGDESVAAEGIPGVGEQVAENRAAHRGSQRDSA